MKKFKFSKKLIGIAVAVTLTVSTAVTVLATQMGSTAASPATQNYCWWWPFPPIPVPTTKCPPPTTTKWCPPPTTKWCPPTTTKCQVYGSATTGNAYVTGNFCSVTSNSYTLSGLSASSCGIEYTVNGSTRRVTERPGNHQTIYLTNLCRGSYSYRFYVTASNGQTFYGNWRNFSVC